MPITIVKKKPASINKTQTTLQNVTAKLFIDSMTVGFDFTDKTEAQDVHSKIMAAVADNKTFRLAKRPGNYTRCWQLNLLTVGKEKHHPRLMYRHSGNLAQRIAINMHPNDMGSNGIEEMNYILTSIIDAGWKVFIDRSSISMLEVTVDLAGVAIRDVHALPEKAFSQKEIANNGRLQTLYLGKRNANQWRIYDRTAKRHAHQQFSYTGEVTRIERILRNTNIKLKDLATVPNTFATLKLADLPLTPPPELSKSKHYIWELFCDSVQHRGLLPALKLLPEASYRSQFRKWLKANEAPYWQPDELWKAWKPLTAKLLVVKGN